MLALCWFVLVSVVLMVMTMTSMWTMTTSIDRDEIAQLAESQRQGLCSPMSTTTTTAAAFTAVSVSLLLLSRSRTRSLSPPLLTPVPVPTDRVARFYSLVDAVNATDPRVDESDGATPKELLYGRRMTAELERLRSEASGFKRRDNVDDDVPDVVKVAVRAQHVARWRIPRSEFPEGRAGYLAWRKRLQRMHADVARELMVQAGGFSEEEREEVRHILCKEDIKGDPLVQLLEDVAALVFLRYEFAAFAGKQEEDKMVDILRKTWKKMSDEGHAAALKIPMSEEQKRLVERALSSSAE